jgi:hypothetical protein
MRPFFPEDIVDSNTLFHLCLLIRLTIDHKKLSMVNRPHLHLAQVQVLSDKKTKIPSSTSGTKGAFDYAQAGSPRYHPELRLQVCVSTCQRLSFAITGNPADDYFVSPSKSLVRETGEFGHDALPMGTVLGFHLTFPTR